MDAMVAETAARVLADRDGDADGLWAALEETGLAGAGAPEALSGVGLEAADLFALMRMAGARGAQVPWAEALLAGRWLGAAGVAAPEGRVCLAIGGRVAGGRLTGDFPAVAFAAQGGTLLAVAEGGLALVELAPGASVAGVGEDHAADLRFDGVPARVTAAPNWLSPAAARAELALARAAQMAGAMEAALELTLAHVGVREQFGRPLSAFQAIQHMLAEMAGEAAAAGAAVEAAAETAGPDAPADWAACAVAKLRAGEAADRVTACAHQAHGAIGYTHDYGLRRLSRALWRWRDEAGDETEWAVALGRAAAADPAPLQRQVLGPATA